MTSGDGDGLAVRRGEDDPVYQPAEDSDLLARTAAADLCSGDRVLEVGCGSGFVAARVAETGAEVVAGDVNPHACRETRERGIQAVRADLVAPFRDGAFDAVLFNPPYLPDEADAARDPADWPGLAAEADWMEVALSGGPSGRAVLNPFLDDVGRVLAPEGAVYLLVSSLTGVEAVVERAAAAGFSAAALADESFPFETLTVLKLVR
jgi:release factor glutamine methyltransferase